ncbi:MAG: DUF255 domain-containing protein, partial [Chloroflexota bacterium]|nr:DUF255 domain-containing protein [Chloroflexota bacterium]
VQALSGQGGWPMSVFLTPQGEPFYGGTYFPPEDRGGHPAFPGVLQAVAEAYRNHRGQVSLAARQVSEALRRASEVRASREPLTPDIFHQAAQRIGSEFDSRYGGFGTAPKFPQPMVLEFLLRHWRRSGDQGALQMVERTLEGMAYGGIYDQVGGGFHRYSTDPFWLAPHFEKMLYDNALLSRLYLHTYQATGRPLYRRIAEETLDYVLREMTVPEGGFYSTQDADSEGHEGRYYVWTPDELASVLGKEDGQQFGRVFGVTLEGNFEGRSILSLPRPPEEAARELGMTPGELAAFVSSCRARLLAARARRTPPARDEKALAAWNGLMLRSFAEAGASLGRRDYIAAAERSADFVLDNLRINGRLMRSYKDGRANHKGY